MRAEETPALEVQVKAAFLIKFGMFAQWPTNGSVTAVVPFKIGVLGKDPFRDFFDQAAQRENIGGRPVQIRRAESAAELADCDIVFIAPSESAKMEQHLAEFEGKPVLTVGDDANFAERGGMIGFIKEAGKVRFEINTRAVEQARIKLSAKLMQVGKVVSPSISQN